MSIEVNVYSGDILEKTAKAMINQGDWNLVYTDLIAIWNSSEKLEKTKIKVQKVAMYLMEQYVNYKNPDWAFKWMEEPNTLSQNQLADEVIKMGVYNHHWKKNLQSDHRVCVNRIFIALNQIKYNEKFSPQKLFDKIPDTDFHPNESHCIIC